MVSLGFFGSGKEGWAGGCLIAVPGAGMKGCWPWDVDAKYWSLKGLLEKPLRIPINRAEDNGIGSEKRGKRSIDVPCKSYWQSNTPPHPSPYAHRFSLLHLSLSFH